MWGAEVVLHTHDEILTECDTDHADDIKTDLIEAMTTLPDWAKGLPLDVDVETGPYYTK